MSSISPARSDYAECTCGYPNFAPHAMYAHRLWISLWTDEGHSEENPGRPGGNAGVTSARPAAAHRCTAGCTRAGHRRCARPRRSLAAQTPVIPGIHRPYDDYQFVIADRSKPK